MPNDTIPSFSTLLRKALGDALAPEATNFVDMFAEAGVMEFPFAPPGGIARIEGKPALIEYLSGLGTMIDLDSMSAPAVHRTVNSGTMILEFTGTARGVASGKMYEQSYISVITLADGLITHYRDYWNPLVVMQVMQDAEAMASS